MARWLRISAFLVAFAIYAIGLDHFSFWIDEALTPLRAEYDIPTILRNVIYIQDTATIDTHPGFYYLFVHFTINIVGNASGNGL